MMSTLASKIFKRRAWEITLAAFLTAVAHAAPAQAGYYEVTSTSGSGSATVSPTGETPTTTNLSDANWGMGNAISGSATYAYTETLYYQWVPDDPMDPESDPAPTEPIPVYLSGTANMSRVEVTDAAYSQAGTGRAVISMGDCECVLEIETTPAMDPCDPPVVSWSGSSLDLYAFATVSGASGSFQLSYSATLSASADAVIGAISFMRDTTLKKRKMIKITYPAPNASVPRGMNPDPFPFQGTWECYFDSNAAGKVRVKMFADTGSGPGDKGATGPPLPPQSGSSGTWEKFITISGSGNAQVKARLEYNFGTTQNPDWDRAARDRKEFIDVDEITVDD